MSKPRKGLQKGRVMIFAAMSKEHDSIEIDVKTEDGSPLTKQDIVDVLGDYLLIDPMKIFKRDLN